MIQPVKEKVMRFRLGDKVQIDNMNFTINLLKINKEQDGVFSVSIWGRKPNATTIAFDRIVRVEELLWKPRKIDTITEKGKIFSLKYDIEDVELFQEEWKNKKDKVVSLLVEMDTMLNEPAIFYDFNK